MSKPKGGSENAFAFAYSDSDNYAKGLSKRQYYAALALQGILTEANDPDFKVAAKMAWQAADALIQAE